MVTELSDFEALNQLVADPALERLNDALAEFNLFEALGVVRQELRHSNFLAWLFNPSENHGLGDYALRKFMMLVTREAQDKTLTPAHVSLWDLEHVVVLREWRNIDVLIAHPNKKYVVVIENKIGTGEHSNQLARYQTIVESEYPQAIKLYIFLSPDGTPPEDEESDYIPLEYGKIHALIGEILKAKHNTLSNDVQVFIQHYQAMLGRSIMTDSDIAKLCRAIYEKNRRALDLIFEYRPDLQSQLKEIVWEFMTSLVNTPTGDSSYPILSANASSRSFISISVDEWKGCPNELRFYFDVRYGIFRIMLVIVKGSPDKRRLLYDIAKAAGKPFTIGNRKLTGDWTNIYRKDFVDLKSSEEVPIEELKAELKNQWDSFLLEDFPKIHQAIKQTAQP